MTTMMLCCCLTIQAAGDDTFVTIDWSSMPLNDEESAPEYRHTETLESGGAWSVSVEYPEYEALAAYETADVERYADRIGEDIHVESEVYEVRGEWRITYHCLPLIYRDGKYQRLLSARFRISKTAQARTAVRAASTVAETRYAARSAMASGRWVKISIAGDGMYRLTPAFLLQAGFTNLSKVHLYGYGGHLQSNSLNADEDFDDLPEIPLYPAADGSLLFWGNGLVNWNGTKRIRNTYAREACYFLSDVGPDGSSDNATRIETIAAGTASGQTVSSVMRHSLIEREEYSMYKVGNKLVSLDDFADGATRSYTFSGINVLFGQENDTFVISNSSMITGTFSKDGENAGAFGGIGPMRLENKKIIPYIEYFTDKVSDLLSRDGGGSEGDDFTNEKEEDEIE